MGVFFLFFRTLGLQDLTRSGITFFLKGLTCPIVLSSYCLIGLTGLTGPNLTTNN